MAMGLALSLVTPSGAAIAAPGETTQAEALFNSGKDAMARGELTVACARFSDSLKLDPAVGTLLNLAACEEKSGKLATALEHFTTARSQLPKDDFRIGFTNERIAALTPRVAHVTLRLAPPAPPGTKVLRDGIEVPPAAWNTAMAIDPGAHTIEAESTTHAASRMEITLREGEAMSIDLRAELAKPSARPAGEPAGSGAPGTGTSQAEAPRPQETSRSNTLAFVATGVGAVGLIAGTITGLMTVGAASTYKDHCHGGQCDPDGLSAASTGQTTQVISPIAFGVGVVGVALGAYLFLRSPSGSPSKASAATTILAPSASPTGGGLMMLRSF